jgi:non-heme chloroperoxidase
VSAERLNNGTLRTGTGFSLSMPTTEAETISADLLTFIET